MNHISSVLYTQHNGVPVTLDRAVGTILEEAYGIQPCDWIGTQLFPRVLLYAYQNPAKADHRNDTAENSMNLSCR